MAELTATLPFSSNLITAEIRVENLSESSISIPQPSQSSSMSQQIAVEESDNNNTSSMSKQQQKEFDEPESKRQKLDTSMKGKKFEKLESRLGSVLCCAVCLDLPKTAMYQVSTTKFHPFCLSTLNSQKSISN
jgi:hypothetical protein